MSVTDAVGLLMVLGFPLASLEWYHTVEKLKEKDKRGFSDDAWSILSSIVKGFVLYPLVLAYAYVWHLFTN